MNDFFFLFSLLLPIESQDQFEFFIEITSTPKTKFIQPSSSTPVKKPSSSNNNNNNNNHTRTSIRPRRTLKRTYCKSAIFFRQLKRTFL